MDTVKMMRFGALAALAATFMGFSAGCCGTATCPTANAKEIVQVTNDAFYTDGKFDAEKGKQAYEAFGQGHRCTLVKGNGGHRFYADAAWPIVHKYLKSTH